MSILRGLWGAGKEAKSWEGSTKSEEESQVELEALRGDNKALDEELKSIKPTFYFKEGKEGPFGAKLSRGYGPEEQPWKGKTTKDPFKDYERLYPEFLMEYPESSDAFTEFTWRRLVHAKYGPDRSVELIKKMQKKLRDQGKI